jgi:uncharacterized membrane protein YoaK (UPF0700 family)
MIRAGIEGLALMLSARAYSLRQKSRLAISLSWIGGYTNVIALLALGTVVSHVTGTATLLGKSIGERSLSHFLFFGWMLLTFLAGAALSALMTEAAKRHGWRSKYILPIALEAVLLSIIAIYMPGHPAGAGAAAAWVGAAGVAPGEISYGFAALASLAMGLQNATITKISGAVVRTTHLTGIFTDLGLEGIQYLFWYKDRLTKRRWERAGRLLRISRRHPSAERLLLLASIAGSLGFGTVAGYLVFTSWSGAALWAPVAFLVWIIWVDLRSPIADIREMDLLNDPELKLHSLVNQLLPREIVLYRFACARGGGNLAHRAPNFQLWLDRVPENCRVVVLAISPLTRFDTNAILDLEAAVKNLHAERRQLIISGVTTAQFKALDALGVARMMDMNNLCPDLEFAIARAIAIVPARRPPEAPARAASLAYAATEAR